MKKANRAELLCTISNQGTTSSSTDDNAGTDVFCRIAASKESAKMLFADQTHIGIFSQKESTRMLVIPREHITRLVYLSDQQLKELLQKAQWCAAQLQSGDDYSFEINNGSPLQGVFHVHLHVIVTHRPTLKNGFGI
jgi:diadenosine tetraphosphate (Ap4A) HIT family hydrolase